MRTARSVFAGPGSPTYALRVWAGTGFDDALAAVATSGGTVTFASAAALTIGVATVPVYEIYKSGADPAWASGTNLLERLTGLRAALMFGNRGHWTEFAVQNARLMPAAKQISGI